jgi:hypothetical protein
MERNRTTIISQFFDERIANYRPPVRKGLKRGEKIGFPLPKERAVLYTMVGLPQKEISEILGMSFSLVRHWCCEPQFKHKVDEYSSEIEKRFLLLVEKFERTYSPKIPTYLKDLSDFGGILDYGPDLAKRIIKAILERVNKRMSFVSLETAYIVIMSCFIDLPSTFKNTISLYKIAATFHKNQDFRKKLLKSKPAWKKEKDFEKGLGEILKMEQDSFNWCAWSFDLKSLGEKLLKYKSWVAEWRLVEPISLNEDWEDMVYETWWHQKATS